MPNISLNPISRTQTHDLEAQRPASASGSSILNNVQTSSAPRGVIARFGNDLKSPAGRAKLMLNTASLALQATAVLSLFVAVNKAEFGRDQAGLCVISCATQSLSTYAMIKRVKLEHTNSKKYS